MRAPLSLFGLLLILSGCAKAPDPTPAAPAPQPAPPGVVPPNPAPPKGDGTDTPKPPATIDRAAEERVIKFLEGIDGRFERSSYVEGNPVTKIYLANSKMTDDGVKEIAVLPHLRLIDFGNTPVTDEGLKHL